jgi:hypothetical protein
MYGKNDHDDIDDEYFIYNVDEMPFFYSNKISV